MLKVLHITESYGGGVTSAINAYAIHSREFAHHLCAFIREQDVTGEEGGSFYASTLFAARTLSGLLQVRRCIIDLNPDVIHIHSTYAGALFRALPFVDPAKVVYTPHGFAFLRNDGPLKTSLYRGVERILTHRTAVMAGCSRSEVIQGQRIGYKVTHELINICGDLPEVTAKPNGELPIIGMVGRACEQKGYQYFADVAQALAGRAHFKWIGGGADLSSELLRQSGVEVTGWVSRQEVLAHLKGLDLYFHSAAWEGFPISVLEAAKLIRPIVLRGIDSFTVENLPVVCSVADAVKELDAWLHGDEQVVQRARDTTMAISGYHSPENLNKSLTALYERFS